MADNNYSSRVNCHASFPFFTSDEMNVMVHFGSFFGDSSSSIVLFFFNFLLYSVLSIFLSSRLLGLFYSSPILSLLFIPLVSCTYIFFLSSSPVFRLLIFIYTFPVFLSRTIFHASSSPVIFQSFPIFCVFSRSF